MRLRAILFALSLISGISIFYSVGTSAGFVQGIYVTQYSAENRKKLQYLIREAKATGISTLIIDVDRTSKRYKRNIELVKKSGLRYVARLVVFPHGATHKQITNKKYWEKRWRLAAYAISLGAKEIQLDYIRYKKTNRASQKNAHYVHEVIKFFRQRMRGTGVKLQIDIFGMAALKPSLHIGQNAPLFANTVDAICPMVYPSHYEPFRWHAVRPYETVHESVSSLKQQLNKHRHVKVYAYIELSNYRYRMPRATKIKYIIAQLKAAREAGAHGWYAWSPGNKYKLLFEVLKNHND